MARNLSVLLVDPNSQSQMDASQALRAVGLDICGQSSFGTEATYMAAEFKPNLIMLALEDPPMRGLATLEALQQQSPDTPVLIYSSSADTQLMRQAMRAGARDFLERPLRDAELRDAIHTVLSQEEQRQIARWSEEASASARGTIITVAGAKGGIGKTAFATNLAVAIRRTTGQEVALIDADAQFGDVGVMLDMQFDRSVADLARDEPEINRHVVQTYMRRHSSGVDVLGAGSEPDDWRALQGPHIAGVARALSETHEYVVIDTPGVMNETVAASLNEAALVFLITSLDVSSVKDTRTAKRILESWAMPVHRIRLVINDNTRAAAVTREDVEQACGLSAAYVIPNDPAVGPSIQTGVPLIDHNPGSRFSRAVLDVAQDITGVSERESTHKSRLTLPKLTLFGRRA